MDREAALERIAHSLLEERVLVDDPEWDAFAILVALAPTVAEMTAFRYSGTGPGKPTPVRATGFALFRDLQAATAAPDGTTWRACTIRIVRDTRKCSVDFMYGDDADQWQITPANFAALAEALRPA